MAVVPFEVLAERCAADVPGLWTSLGNDVRAAARQAADPPRLSGLVLTGPLAGAAGVALLIFLAELGRGPLGWPPRCSPGRWSAWFQLWWAR